MSTGPKRFEAATTWDEVRAILREDGDRIRLGGGPDRIDRQHQKGRLTARERIAALVDSEADFFEVGFYAADGMYEEWGGAPGAGVVTGIGRVETKLFMIIANDATVKAGAFFPLTVKKVLRAQRIAMDNCLPLIYLVDSAGVFLPLQDEIFPDVDDFGRIFRNNARMSARGIAQIAAIMGNCVAGGAYAPSHVRQDLDDGREWSLHRGPIPGQSRHRTGPRERETGWSRTSCPTLGHH